MDVRMAVERAFDTAAGKGDASAEQRGGAQAASKAAERAGLSVAKWGEPSGDKKACSMAVLWGEETAGRKAEKRAQTAEAWWVDWKEDD